MKIFSEVMNIAGIIIGAIGSAITLIRIGVYLAGMQQQPKPVETPICTVVQ